MASQKTLDNADQRGWLILVGLLMICLQAVGSNALGQDQNTAEKLTTQSKLQEFAELKFLMATPWTFRFYASDPTAAKQVIHEITQRVKDLTHVMSDYEPDSEIRKLYESAKPEQPVQVSQDLFKVLNFSEQLSQQTGGAFDVTLGPLIDLWREAKLRHQLPTRQQIDDAKARSGFRFLKLHAESQQISLLKRGMHVDLGGIGKGFAADEVAAVFQKHGIDSFLIDAGGTICVGSPPPGKLGWKIKTQFGPAHKGLPETIQLSHAAVSTSGDQQRFVEIQGKRYSHIVSPDTGLGTTQSRMVMVIGPSAAQTDAYATALCLLEAEECVRLMKQQPRYQAYQLLKDSHQPNARQTVRRFNVSQQAASSAPCE